MRTDLDAGSISQADLMRLLGEARLWLESPAGEMLLEQQREVAGEALQRCFGQHMVQYGLAPDLMDGQQSTLRNRWHFDLIGQPPLMPLEESQWPFAPQSIDAVLLHHGLDFCLAPRTLLREAGQAVRAGGHLLIFGFNPWSSWGWNHFAGRSWLSEAGFISPARLADWLEVLGFAVEKRINGCYLPPLKSRRKLERLMPLERWAGSHKLPCGGFYCLIARRQMLGAMPRKQPARAFPAIALPPLVAGTRRTQKRNTK